MRIDLERTAGELLGHDNILIICHASPDGDTLGSGYGLCLALQKIGKKARVVCDDEIPACLSFVPDGVESQEFEPEYIVAVDVASVSMLGSDGFTEYYKDKIDLCIDHHFSNTDFAPLTFIETDISAAAAAETILLLIRRMGVVIDREIAECIYVALATDTGCFRYSNTTSRTMRMAADMIDAGIDIERINKIVFETRSRNYMKLEAMALAGMKVTPDGKIAVITVTKEMFEESGCEENEFQPIKGIPATIEGVLVGVSMREKENGEFRVSVRTVAPVSANGICGEFGGGGHIRASGCSIFGTAEECAARITEAAYKYIV